MKSLGYEWERHETKVALHDYYQYYRDIYKKMYINAKKAKANCKKLFPRWQRLSEKDMDFKVCIKGLGAGKEHSGPLAIDYTKSYGFKDEFPEKEPITDLKEYERAINEKDYNRYI
jgi:hypothetical protein